MRIDGSSVSVKPVISSTVETFGTKPQFKEYVDLPLQPAQSTSKQGEPEIPFEKLEKAVDSLNELFKINNSELKFVLHEGLGKYYAQLVDSETEEIVREIPSKKILDVFYEMQKLIGLFVDKKI